MTFDFTSFSTVFESYQDKRLCAMETRLRLGRVCLELGSIVVVVVVLLFYVHGKHLRSCRNGQLT